MGTGAQHHHHFSPSGGRNISRNRMSSSLFKRPFVRVCLLGTVDNASPLHALKGNYRLTELLFKKHVLPEAEAISLHEAAKNGDIRGVCLVLNWTMASVDTKGEYGYTALLWAARNGHAEIVQILLDADANVDSKDNFGRTVLDYAKQY